MITLTTELSRIRGLSPSFIGKLAKLEIITVRDLLFHFPTRYEDFSRVVQIAELQPNQPATIRGTIRKLELRRTWKKRMLLTEAVIADETGGVKAIWFNQPYIVKALRVGMPVNLAGKVATGDEGVYLSNPSYELARSEGEARHTAGLIPIYPETRGLTSRGIRYLVKPILKVLPLIPEFIPGEILEENRLPELNRALRMIHFPFSLSEAERAKARFAFEDLFLLQIMNFKFRSALAKETALPIQGSTEDLLQLTSILPFTLTSSQRRSLDEILKDIASPRPMNRLLQGDVGSGKTVVAAIAAILAVRSGTQAVFMAPTEILARQHHGTLMRLFSSLLKKWNITAALLVGGEARTRKREATGRIREGNVGIAIGTHALLEEGVSFKKLGLVIVDEQHRFGVSQRAALANREAQAVPHFLSMSATPIPRTLTLTVFGDLDVSIIFELPAGRKPVTTRVVPRAKRGDAYAFIRKEIRNGRQAFVICPRIEVSGEKFEAGNHSPTSNLRPPASLGWNEARAVKEEYEKLSKQIFPDLRVGMLHGKIKSREKEEVMEKFRRGEVDLLVATSVVEVGVDVPNATIMLVEGADYFGLAQLYQLRGRIGRGEHASYCFLFTESGDGNGEERLHALMKAKNGFELAELDLALRGPGEFLGERQTGIPDLAMKSLANVALIKAAREAASVIVARDSALENYPFLRERLQGFEHTVHLE